MTREGGSRLRSHLGGGACRTCFLLQYGYSRRFRYLRSYLGMLGSPMSMPRYFQSGIAHLFLPLFSCKLERETVHGSLVPCRGCLLAFCPYLP